MHARIAPPVDIRTKKAWQVAVWISAFPARPARPDHGTTRRALKRRAHACPAVQVDTEQHPLQSAEMSAGRASWVNFLTQWAQKILQRAFAAQKVFRSRWADSRSACHAIQERLRLHQEVSRAVHIALLVSTPSRLLERFASLALVVIVPIPKLQSV